MKEWLFEEPNTQPWLVTYITFLVTCGSSLEGRPPPPLLVRVWKKKKIPTTRSRPSPSRPLIAFYWSALMPWKILNSPHEIKSTSPWPSVRCSRLALLNSSHSGENEKSLKWPGLFSLREIQYVAVRGISSDNVSAGKELFVDAVISQHL